MSTLICRYGHIIFKDDSKMGFATLLVLKCESKKCNYSKCFYTSSKVNGSQAFEVNHRIVLAMRSLGIRHQGLANFAGAMNVLAPMNENSYRDHVAVVCNAADNEAKQRMENAVKQTKEFYEAENNAIYNIAVPGAGTWRRRGYSTAYGVFTALSTMTGKVLDVKIMSKECRECMV